MQLPNDGEEFFWASVHHSPEALSTDCVEIVSQSDVGGKQVGILFLTFFLHVSCGEHHVDCTAILLEAALTLRQETVLKMFDESVQENPSQRLACEGERGNATVVTTCLSSPFRLYRWVMDASFKS